MAVYCVTYDLKAPGKDYSSLHDHLKKYAYCKRLESFWLIDTQKTASQIRDDLKNVVDSNDVVFVARLQGNWASWNYGCGDWLNDKNRKW